MARPKRKKPKSRGRDYAAEYRRRCELAEAKGYSKSVARGHPRDTEVGRAELGRMRSARRAMSPGEQRAVGVRRPVQSYRRREAHDRIVELVGVDAPTSVRDARTRRDSDGSAFVAYCTEVLGMTPHEAWTLWFSP